MRNELEVLVEKPKDHLGELGVYGRTIFMWISQKKDVRTCTGFIWLRVTL